MAKVRLSDPTIRKYKPVPGKVREISDALSEGLALSILPSGTRTWTMRFRRPSGKQGQLTLGRYMPSEHEVVEGTIDMSRIGTPLTLTTARALASWVHVQRRLGKDIVAEYQASKHRAKAQAVNNEANSFAAASREFIDEVAKTKRRRWKDMAITLGWDYTDEDEPVMRQGGLAKRWADKPVSDIDDNDIFQIVRESGRSGVPGCAVKTKGRSASRERAMFGALSSMFKWLKGERRVKVNPCPGAVPLEPFVVRDRVLNIDEIVWFWRACEAEGKPFGTILKLLLLSAQRLNEIAAMRYSELDDGVLTLPASRVKNKRRHVVPLPKQAIALIPDADDSDLVFTTTGVTPVSGWSTLKMRIDKAMAKYAEAEGKTVPAWTFHDLRRTAITGMNELGISPWVVEQIVNHVSGTRGGVAGNYNYSQLLPKRKAALQRWADHIQALVESRL
jgi:integrase